MKKTKKKTVIFVLTAAMMMQSCFITSYAEEHNESETLVEESIIELETSVEESVIETEVISEMDSEKEIASETEVDYETEQEMIFENVEDIIEVPESVEVLNQNSEDIVKDSEELASVSNLNALTIGRGKVELTWNPVEGAEGYRIYRYFEGEEIQEFIGETSGESYVDTEASQENMNYYRVYPYYMFGTTIIEGTCDQTANSSGCLDEHAKLKAVQNLKFETIRKGMITISWDPIEGAEGYYVYSQISGSSVKSRKVQDTYYVDTSASETRDNIYYVVPYHSYGLKAVEGTACDSISAKAVYMEDGNVTPVSTVYKAEGVGSNAVYLKWNTVDDADGYYIYYYDQSGKYEYKYKDKVVQVEGAAFQDYYDSTASAERVNYYRIYSYRIFNGETVVSSYAKETSAFGGLSSGLEQVRGLKAAGTGNGKVNVSWLPVQSAEGYYVYRSNDSKNADVQLHIKMSGSGFEFLGAVKGTEYVDLKASATSTNYYWVYPYATSRIGDEIVGVECESVSAKGILETEDASTLKVRNVRAIGLGDGRIRLTWDPVEGATSYFVISEVEENMAEIIATTSETTYIDTGVSRNVYTYYMIEPSFKNDPFLGMKCVSDFVCAKGKAGDQLGPIQGLKAASAGKNKVKLSWEKIDDAEGYLVYGQKNGKYGYVGMTSKGTTTTFIDSKALDSDYNFYWVFPYIKDVDGSMVPGGCTKYVYAKGVCPAVTNLKASSVSGGVKLTWSASAGAEGYLIYGIENGGQYGYVGMTSKGTTTTFTAKKASKTDYNFYWVYPYHKDANGKMIIGGTAPYTYGRAK